MEATMARKPHKPTPKMLAAGGKTAYESWVREAGLEKNASIKDYAKQPTYIHTRWERVAADVYLAMREAT
jgi:hypothetical protein